MGTSSNEAGSPLGSPAVEDVVPAGIAAIVIAPLPTPRTGLMEIHDASVEARQEPSPGTASVTSRDPPVVGAAQFWSLIVAGLAFAVVVGAAGGL